ncbi:MAG: cyclic nucleotide-binding domain-containing protein [Blastochloris sp.]|nr:cyclic nucleotide-binding domain-containing protein [Blastochloris sp.]
MSTTFDRPTLPAVGWVANLAEDDRNLLASYGEFLGIQPDHDMIRQGEDQNQVFLVISGKLEVRRMGMQDDLVMGLIKAGESIGEIALFDVGPASASIRALEFCQVWVIDRTAITGFVTDNPVAGNLLLFGLATILSQRARTLSNQVVDAREG